MQQYADIHLFIAKSLYMFRVSQHPSSGVLKTVTAASGTGHNTGAATSLQHGLIRPLSYPVHVCNGACKKYNWHILLLQACDILVKYFLDVFAKLRRATVSFVTSVRLSTWNTSAPTGRTFMKFYSSGIFRKSVEKIQVSLKSDKNKGYFTWRQMYILLYLAHFFLEWEMLQANVVQKIKTHILCSVTLFFFFFFRNCTVYEKM